MSFGNLAGSFFTSIMCSALWLVLGAALDKVCSVFNRTMNFLPTFQDAVTGFQMTQTIWMVILVVMWLAIWINYTMNEMNQAGGYV